MGYLTQCTRQVKMPLVPSNRNPWFALD